MKIISCAGLYTFHFLLKPNLIKYTKKRIYTFLLFILVVNSLFAQPTISSFSPTSGSIGTEVTINGNNFDNVASNNIVYFGAVKAVVTTATTNALTVIVPPGATYLPISVTTNNLSAYSSEPFIPTFSSCGEVNAQSFATAINYATGSNPLNIYPADLDGDGKADLAAVNMYSGTISIYRNTGTPGKISFDSKVDFSVGNYPQNINIGDLDGDGKSEIIIAYSSASIISVLRNTSIPGTLSFATKVDLSTGYNP
ncbi:MAG: FG-GAP-like repeat-containing protein, partial [Bacteroidota bacterium]|nr:FG-GAP-like repeat-containing protein [Bacteroidota bacterium]